MLNALDAIVIPIFACLEKNKPHAKGKIMPIKGNLGVRVSWVEKWDCLLPIMGNLVIDYCWNVSAIKKYVSWLAL